MSLSPTSFTQAEFLDQPDIPVINAPARPDTHLFTRALLFGFGGAVAGAALDAAFLGITHFNIGYLALGVAWLVAKAMVTGSKGQGGRWYQISAVILTYLAVSAAHSALLVWEIRREGEQVPLSLHNVVAVARYGVLSPFLRFQTAGIGALLGLIILFVGLRAAWRMTSGNPNDVRHPFAR